MPPAAHLPLNTERLSLRLRHSGDEGWLHQIYSQPEVARYLLDRPWSREQTDQKLAERVGMTREAHHRQNWWSKGEWTDTLVYAALATD